MGRPQSSVGTLVLLVLLVVLFYPALFLAHRVAPEASLRTSPPWRSQLGPVPQPGAAALRAARDLGPRLAAMERDGLAVALWNPLIGGGRGGWLSSPAEGGAPLPVLAVLLARPGWTWTALLALEVGICFLACFWLLRRHRLGPWPAAAGAVVFSLSGPVAGHWLDWQGSAASLAPLVLAPAFLSTASRSWRVAAWSGGILLAILCGPPAWPLVALAAVLELLASRPAPVRQRGLVVAAGAGLALAVAMPVLWLARASAEPGAPPFPPAVASSPLRIADLVVPPAAARGPSEAPQSLSPATPAYVGWSAAILAVLGLAAARRRAGAVWLGALAGAAIVSHVPPEALPAGIPFESLSCVVALALAALAAFGAARLLRDLRGWWAETVGALVTLALLSTLLPAATRSLPLGGRDEGAPASPLPPSTFADGSRMVALLDAIPPDSAAALGLSDVRAGDLTAEPGYAAVLGMSPDRTLPLSRALDPDLARLGARWIVEPLPLRVVSGSIFAAVEPSDTAAAEPSATFAAVDVDVPRGACRVGVPAHTGVQSLTVERGGRHVGLREDRALSGESDDWSWYAIPDGTAAQPARLNVRLSRPTASPLSLAWDRSGLRLAAEGDGIRLWERAGVRPFAFIADAIAVDGEGGGGEAVLVPTGLLATLRPLAAAHARAAIERVNRAPSRVEIAVVADAAALLVVQVKHRPLLWRAVSNGRPIATFPADGAWTGIPLAAGRNEVTLAAHLPAWVLATSLVGALAVLALILKGRKA